MKLVIVESHTKAKSISHFLGKGFKVVACYGHVRDLPKSKLGIDIENNFAPYYIIPMKARKKVNELKKLANKSSNIILATDEDREGEAIAFHLIQALEIEKKMVERIAFHEITKPAIEDAMKSPRNINLDLVNAQQTRRILDRLVGYELSPFLWKKVFRGLSAGRVQSPALRLIVEREKERESFKEEKYYTISALMQKQQTTNTFESILCKINDETIPKLGIKTKAKAKEITDELKSCEFKVSQIEKKQIKRNPSSPFTTSTLQQEAAKRLRFSAKQTMRLAQNLYENGAITYHRTDSLNLSQESVRQATDWIKKNLDKKYVLQTPRFFKTKSKLAQEAHEAIRPTNPNNVPEKIKLEAAEKKLYELIWRRFMASQLPEAIFDSTQVKIKAKNPLCNNCYLLTASGNILSFDGFLKIWTQKFEEKGLPSLKEKEILELKKVKSNEHLTQPPPRYNDASLVKTLESFGIGRPSTYAPIISVLEYRGYVARDKSKSFIPTEIGTLVNGVLIKHFPNIVDYKFTSQIEEKLDNIAQGKLDWVNMVGEFYKPFKDNLEKKYKEVSKEELAPVVETKEKCPNCGNNLVLKLGRFGKFLACSDWPKCKFTKSINNEFSMKCPQCKTGDIIMKRNKRKQMFYACSQWPECDFASSYKPTGEDCPKCSKPLVEMKSKIKCSNRNCNYEIPKTENNSES